jgi:probable HAF family extracellular repeat protein
MFGLFNLPAPHLSAAPPPADKVTILPDIPDASYFAPLDINNQGQIIGWSYDSSFNARGFIYSDGKYTDFEVMNGTFPADITNSGRIPGTYYDADCYTWNFLYDRGTFTKLEIPGAMFTWVNGMNERGQIVGTFYDAEFIVRNFVWNP